MTIAGLLVLALLLAGSALPRRAAAEACPELSPSQQVAQVLGVPLRDPTVSDDIRALAADRVGTLVLLGGAIESADQVRTLVAVLDDAAPAGVPPLIAVDEEGGRVARFGRSGVTTHLPSARTQAQTMTVEQVAGAARALGQQMAVLGVDLDLAPVLDLTDAAAATIIGDRSFSGDPSRAGAYASAFARGLQEAGIATSGKHFPDHGLTIVDTHTAVASVEVSRDRLTSHHLQPYRAALPHLDSIMLSHLRVSSLDPGLPASLSPAAVAFLRQELAYTGPLVTDDLSMQAVASIADQPTAALMALQAGVDLMLVGTFPGAVAAHQRILEALSSGELSRTRLVSAARRVLDMKGLSGTMGSCLLGLPPIGEADSARAPDGSMFLISDGQRHRLPDEETRSAHRVRPMDYSANEVAGLVEGRPVPTVRRYASAVVAAPGTDAATVAVARAVNQYGPAGAPGMVVVGDTRPWVMALAASLSAVGVPVLPPVQADGVRQELIGRVAVPSGVVDILGTDVVDPLGRTVRRVPIQDPIASALAVRTILPADTRTDGPVLVADPAVDVLATMTSWIAGRRMVVLYTDPGTLDTAVARVTEGGAGQVYTLGLDPAVSAALAGQVLPTDPTGFANWAFRSREMTADLLLHADPAHLLAALPLATAAGAIPVQSGATAVPGDIGDVVRGWGLPPGATVTAYLAGAPDDGIAGLGIPVVYGRGVPPGR